MAFLSEINTEGEAASAASVAALLGKCKPRDSLKQAKENFRSICFSDLCAKDFLQNREATVRFNALYEKTNPAKLGQCDAFIRCKDFQKMKLQSKLNRGDCLQAV